MVQPLLTSSKMIKYLIIALVLCQSLSASFLNYRSKVQQIAGDDLARFYMLDESSGTSALDVSGNANGTYTNSPSLAAVSGIDGRKAPSFDGVDEYVDGGAIGSELTVDSGNYSMGAFIRVSAVGIWTDGLQHIALEARESSSNRARIQITNDNMIRMQYRPQSTAFNVDITTSTTGWFFAALTTDDSGTLTGFLREAGGVLQTDTTNITTAWTGSGSWGSNIGVGTRSNSPPVDPWDGDIAYAFVINRTLTEAEMGSLSQP